MSTAILLSSSPPRRFARSPTPVDSSPYLPSPSEIFQGKSRSPKKFKTSNATRDGFIGGFSSARSLLGVKHGAENIPPCPPAGDKFKPLSVSSQSPRPKFNTQAQDRNDELLGVNIKAQAPKSKDTESTTSLAKSSVGNQPSTRPLLIEELPPDPAPIHPAVPRRTDWTPLKDNSVTTEEQGTVQDASTSFPNGLMASFGCEMAPESEGRSGRPLSKLPNPVKRRKIDLVETPVSLQNPLKEAVRKLQSQTKPVAKKRTKSPAKKPMTITHLATSNYFGREDAAKESPMMQYLSSTQIRDAGVADVDDIEILAKGVKQRSKKPAARKVRSSKARLLSPKSALQSLQVQEAVFGSASQLVQEEHVAAKNDLPSDPVSPQRTQPISIASTTPRTDRGTSKFIRTRGLWAAAGRDEDNALLHVETVDLFDTPCMKEAFAGKDALVAHMQSEARSNQHISSETSAPLRRSHSPLTVTQRPTIFDADEVQSPSVRIGAQVRTVHTRAEQNKVTSNYAVAVNEQNQQQSRKRVSANDAAPERKAPKKPSYAGLDTSVLQKQLKAYGFKPVKKREKMIELLEMCWEAKHGKEEKPHEDDPLKHGDFLSKVHDVSSRPVPKVKKPRKRTKAETDTTSPVKVLKRRKKPTPTALEAGEDPKPKKPRKSRAKKTVITAEIVAENEDNDTLETSAPLPLTAKVIDHADRVLTPPPTLPPEELSEREADIDLPGVKGTATVQVSEKALEEQIHAAILRQSTDAANSTRDHVRDPTWHEKILMYDPIILEDLTAWLNTEGLNKVNEDREVSTLNVRAWCESKGVCCLWKGGWRGHGGLSAGYELSRL